MSDLQPQSENLNLAKVLIPSALLSIIFFFPRWYWTEQDYSLVACNESKDSANHHKEGSDNRPSTLKELGVSEDHKKSNKPEDCADQHPPKGYSTLHDPVTVQWFIFFAALGTGIAVSWQAFMAKRSADAAKSSAEAARLNAQAVINSERAWMATTFDGAVVKDVKEINYPCYVKNFGRTPAKIVEVGATIRRVDSISKIPNEPTFSPDEIIPCRDIVVVPNDGFELPIKHTVSITLAEQANVINGILVVYAYGYVNVLPQSEMESPPVKIATRERTHERRTQASRP
jgi:hypothetical protein